MDKWINWWIDKWVMDESQIYRFTNFANQVCIYFLNSTLEAHTLKKNYAMAYASLFLIQGFYKISKLIFSYLLYLDSLHM